MVKLLIAFVLCYYAKKNEESYQKKTWFLFFLIHSS